MTKEKKEQLIRHLKYNLEIGADYLITDENAVEIIKALEQQPKTGKWEYVQYDYNPDLGNWHCSECRGICTEMHSIEDAYNYCPNCGAKMEVEE